MPGTTQRPDLRVARRISRELMAAGARAVVLTGSRARGDHGEHSDLDLVAVGAGPKYELLHRAGFLVAVSFKAAAKVRRSFGDPGAAGGAVPGWREAVVIDDPSGVAARLKRQAARWTWDSVEPACDEWVAREFTGWSEEVHKLVSMLEHGQTLGAAVQRSILAVRLAPIMAVHCRILYGSENRLWDLVAETMGEPWASTQRAALGLDAASFDESCGAALRLFVLTADELMPLLDRRQREVVAHACKLARQTT